MEEQQYLTRSRVAALFGVSPQSVTRWAREGRLPCVLTLGGQRRYPRDAVARLLKEMRREARLGTERSDGAAPSAEAPQPVSR